jgi:peptidoglycan/LPS O-acetylase OafA/YrhL
MSTVKMVCDAPAGQSLETTRAEDAGQQTSDKDLRKDLYIPILDGIRGIAFLLVFVAHAGLSMIVPGGFGVTVFFFLSGYLITTLLRLEAMKTNAISLQDFYIRRAFRILPPMYVALAVAYAIGATGVLREAGNWFGLISVSAYFYNYANLLHANAILPTGSGVLWSLMVEEHFYLIFPFVYGIFIRKKLSVRNQVHILLACCFVALLWRLVLIFIFHTPSASTAFPRWTYSGSDARFDAILFGAILAIRNNSSFHDASPLLERRKGLFAAIGLIVILASFVIREPHFRETVRYSIQSMALYPIFYYCVSSSNAWPVRWILWKPLCYVGLISYSMYLFHYVVMSAGQDHFPHHMVIVAIVSFALSVMYAWLVRVWIELPSRRWKAYFQRRISAKA